MKRLFCFLSSLLVIVALLTPVSVFAEDSGSYVIYDGCGPWVVDNSNNNSYYVTLTSSNNSELRLVAIGTSSALEVYALSASPFTVDISSSSCPVGTANNNAHSFRGVYSRRLFPIISSSSSGDYTFLKNIPLKPVGNSGSEFSAYWYTYGNGSTGPVAPGPSISYGDIEASYTTKIAGSRLQAVNNADVISWRDLDTNGNSLSEVGAMVEIRVSSGDYFSTVSESDLLSKLFSDFSLDGSSYVSSFSASLGSASFVWSDVIDALSIGTVSALYRPFLKNSGWMLKGWTYEARFVVDGYSSPWKMLYSVTSSGVENQQTIINNTDYNYKVYNAFQDITNINDADSITYNIYNNDYTINNSNITDSSNNDDGSKKGSFWDFLSTIVDAIKDLIKGLFDFVSGLFDIDFNFNINSDIDSVKNNSGFFGQVVTIEQDIKTELENIEVSENFVLEYDAYIINNVTIIPAGSIPVSEYFSALGLTHSDLYFYTDAIVYISLLVLVSKTLINFLKR